MNFVRESIFVGAVRSFCTALAMILGVAFAIGIVGIAFAFIVGPQYVPPKADPTIMPDAMGQRSLLPGHSPAILRIDLRGVIGIGDLTGDKIENILLDSREDFLKGDRVKAILLYINTPGGTSDDCDVIYRALLNYKTKYHVPIYAYVEGMCASAGMYIACTADKIYASSESIIGSVGVRLGPVFNFSEAMTKVGVGQITLIEGKDKDALNPFRPWAPNEDTDIKEIMAVLYDRFLTIVTAARPKLTKEQLINTYGAHIFAAKKAEELGYIDASDMDYSRSLTDLAVAAQIGEASYQVVQLIPQHPFLTGLTQSISPHKFLQSIGLASPVHHPNLSGKFLYLYQP
jgi:signal peptide peptidase SppA